MLGLSQPVDELADSMSDNSLQLIRQGSIDPKRYIYDLEDRREVYFSPARDKILRPIRNAVALRAVNFLRDAFNVEEIDGDIAIQKKITFPNNIRVWSSLQVSHQASFVLELYDVLKGLNVNLFDGHPYNVMFDGAQFKWVDLGSLRRPDEASGSCVREINQYAAVGPFYRIAYCRALRQSNYRTGENEEMLKAGFAGLAEQDIALSWAEKFYRLRDGDKHRRDGTWIDYSPPIASIEGTVDDGQYAGAIIRLIAERGVRTMMDIGCNNGRYTVVAAKRGVEVVALDIEDALICELYEYARLRNLPITPLVSDFRLYCQVVDGTPEVFRPQCDLVVAYAILHHLVHRFDYRFERFFDEIAKFSPKTILLDFVDYSDVYLKRQQARDWYTIDNFLACARAKGFAHESEPSTTNSARTLIVLTRN
jgi:SAM-dependent methyltransferase